MLLAIVIGPTANPLYPVDIVMFEDIVLLFRKTLSVVIIPLAVSPFFTIKFELLVAMVHFPRGCVYILFSIGDYH